MFGSDNLQHKFYQPLLIGIFLLFWTMWCYSALSAGTRVLTNATLFLGCPIYFGLIYSAVFITLVPGYNWVTFFDSILMNMQTTCDWISKLTGMIFNLSIIIFVCMYREKLFRFLGLDTMQLVRFNLWDIADPSYRERAFIGVKVAIKRVSGKLPAGDIATRSNDLFIQVKCGDNEPVNTRVHNSTRAEQNADVRFEEVLQINIPKDQESQDKVFILIKDQEIMGSDELARKNLSMREIYETWFDAENFGSYTVDKSIVSDPRSGLQIIQDGQICHQGAFREYALNFLSENANASITIAMFPADIRAIEHLQHQSALSKLTGGFFGGSMEMGELASSRNQGVRDYHSSEQQGTDYQYMGSGPLVGQRQQQGGEYQYLAPTHDPTALEK
jgi:hypothetical protein